MILILILSLALRLFGLERSPATVNWDEASLGYNAYSLLLTGKDEYGKRWPLSLRSFSDYKPALYSWLSVPLIAIGGLNQTTTRAVSAIAGTASLLGLWLFLGLWIKNRKAKLLFLLFLSFEPWRLHFSRTALETNLSSAFFIFGSYFLFKYRQNFKNFWWVVIFYGLSIFSYHSARMAVPALIFMMIVDSIFLANRKNLKNLIVMLFFVSALILPLFLESKGGQVLARFEMENLFSRYWPYAPVELFKYDLVSWFRLNPLYYLLELVFGHIVAYISPVNFTVNVFHWIRHSVQYIPEIGTFGWWEIAGLIVGIVTLIRNVKSYKYRFLFYWLIAAAAPAAVTWNWFHTLRFANGLPAVELIIAIGFWQIITKLLRFKKWGYMLIGIIIAAFVWQSIFIVKNELSYSVYENHGEYQPGGFKEGVELIKKLEKDYDQIIIDSPQAQSYIFILFYGSYDPKIIQAKAYSRVKPDNLGSWNIDFEKFIFRDIKWEEDKNRKRTILWMEDKINIDELKSMKNAKYYYLKNPVKPFNSGILITLE